MRVLFVIRAVEHYPYFRSIVEALLDRDHDVKILFDRDWSQRGLDLVGIKLKGVSYGWTVPYLVRLRRIIFWIRDLLSYIRYLKVRGQSGFYKDRWRKVLFVPVQWFLKIPFVEFLLKTKVTGRVLAVLETVTGPVSEIVEDIRQFDPAVVVATPANMPHSSADLEYLKAARALSIPTALPVFSWDNLTTKGLIHIKPKVLLAWNEKQVQEAWKHHGIAKRDIRI
ncbi:hypothetical protein HYU92_05875 [Candidatus Curtissbacteria bacterium]|nr:hypothetical protein [Candidatus Curtissbacteria bacterium]